MYAKALTIIEGTPLPLFIVTTQAGGAMLDQLGRQGWVRFGEFAKPAGILHLTTDVVEIVSGDYLVLSDPLGNSASPEGWWDAVSKLDNHCYVLVAEDSALDLYSGDLLQQVEHLKWSPRAAAAVLPVKN